MRKSVHTLIFILTAWTLSVGILAPAYGSSEMPSPEKDIKVNETVDEYGDEEPITIYDPLEPFNRVMFEFNDKLYFWVVKPVAQGYGEVMPEPVRAGVNRFFHNLSFPVRFINCLLQANFKGALTELGRFSINTIWGIGGILDPAGNEDINLTPYEEDFGRTLASYGIGHGFFIMWPIFGPSSLRDTFGSLGDHFLQPVSYIRPWYTETAIKGYDKINDASLRIGDYESLKEAAIDAYVAVRNAYIQHREKRGGRTGFIAPPTKQKRESDK
ncbi:MAG: VacJ family lipoprotein [Syntrophales bacterium]|nr:VacJ family lipoprotein [Syntrophales bacterium]